MSVCVCVCVCVCVWSTNLQRLVEQTGSTSTVEEVVIFLHVAVREPLRQVEAVQHKHSITLVHWTQPCRTQPCCQAQTALLSGSDRTAVRLRQDCCQAQTGQPAQLQEGCCCITAASYVPMNTHTEIQSMNTHTLFSLFITSQKL